MKETLTPRYTGKSLKRKRNNYLILNSLFINGLYSFKQKNGIGECFTMTKCLSCMYKAQLQSLVPVCGGDKDKFFDVKSFWGTGKMAQWVKMQGYKPEDLSSIPGTHMIER